MSSIDFTSPKQSSIQYRCNSSRLIALVQEWAKEIQQFPINEIASNNSPWIDRIRLIAASTSFLGFSRIAKICRTLNAAIKTINDDTVPLSTVKTKLITLTFQTLSELISKPVFDPTDEGSDVTLLIEKLALGFGLSEDDLSEPVFCESNEYEGLLEVGSSKPITDVEHTDADVYQSASLDALSKCAQEESWTVSQLITLAEDISNGTGSDRTAHRLMNIFRSHPFFQRLDRVCLVGRVHQSNQLVVVDSCLSSRSPENTLRKGYSCFVNPEGSLFKMKPGTVRVFADSDRVLASFAQQKKPAQRSIALIADLGLRSGLCLAVGRGAQIQGFLFMNSQELGMFENIMREYNPILSLLALVSNVGLDASGFYVGMPADSKLYESQLPHHSIRFEKEQFRQFIVQSLKAATSANALIEVECNIDNAFLYLPNTVAGAVVKLIDHLGLSWKNPNRPIRISLSRNSSTVSIEIAHVVLSSIETDCEWVARVVQSLNEEFECRPLSFVQKSSSVVVQFPFEPILSASKAVSYSVVY